MSQLVSIIMPVYNAASFFEESLESIKAQTYNNWQLVVVDDGSTDTSVEMYTAFANNHPNKCLYLPSAKKQSGAGVCRNMGLKKCKGELVIFFDADDVLEPFCLEQRVNTLGENDMAVFKQYYWGASSKMPYKIFNGKAANKKDAIGAFMKMEAPWQTMAPIWRKTTLQNLNGFDETLVYMEDPDIHLRALLSEEIKISFEYGLPADNFYRINNMSTTKLDIFYNNSIKSRIIFLKKQLALLDTTAAPYKKDIRFGYFTFLKNFVLARFSFYKEEILDLTNELLHAEVLSKTDNLRLQLIFKIFLSKSNFVKAMRLKGLAYKLI